MDNKFALGLDVSKRTIDVCLLGTDGRTLKTQISNGPAGFQQLIVWLHGIEPSHIHVCLEPTGKYSRAIAHFLHSKGYKVSQVNSYAVLSHGRSKQFRSKNDSIDAYLLSDYCLKHNPPTWIPTEQSQLKLRAFEDRISELDQMIRQEANRLEAGVDSDVVERDILNHIANLKVSKERMEKEAIAVSQDDPVLKQNYAIINSIIGLGERSTLRLLAFVRLELFAQSRNVGCFAGMTPRQYRSGTSIHKHESISRVGSRHLRELLFFPAMVAIQHNPQMRAFAERLQARGKAPKVIICAVMRKLLVLAATLVRKQELYDSTRGLNQAT